MSSEVINQAPTVGRAKELEQQAKEGLKQLKVGQDMVIAACHKMRDTKAYSTLGFETYHAWGESTLNLKKSRLNELALAGEVQQELLIKVAAKVTGSDSQGVFKHADLSENSASSIEVSDSVAEEVIEKQASDMVSIPVDSVAMTPFELSDISTPQLVALAKAPKGERLAVLDKVAIEAKAEDKPITTSTIKEAIKAAAEPVVLSADEQAKEIKKSHRLAMGKVSKLGETLRELDTAQVNSEEVESWKTYLDEAKESIMALEKNLGYY
ncbi:MAG: hypothetical protein methR_P0419 [Methyloprofundus sp.]|nr:MAG: hypothetical protein methR_P0419 [Methyloprofundus sp.]